MALTHKHRTALYEGLSGIVDEEAVDEMLAYFPTRDGDEPINRDFLRAEMSDLRTELRSEMSDLRTELRSEMSDMETRLVDRIDTKFNQVIAANLATLVAFAAVIIAAVRL
jgi:hypothetical protein